MNFDYTDVYEMAVKIACVQGIDKLFIEKHETLYYDESGNAKHLVIKGNTLNADTSLVFVLGGIHAEDTIPLNDLKSYMGCSLGKELKANNDLKGTFSDILRKDKLQKILQLIESKNWNIHFNANQILYYAFVDIIDSINDCKKFSIELKSILYDILKKDPTKTINHFKKYNYPNLKKEEICLFIDGILSIIDKEIEDNPMVIMSKPLVVRLRMCFEKAKSQDSLIFIQDETPNIWVSDFVQFYRNEIIIFKNKSLIFDEEKQVQSILEKENITINNKSLSNFSFVNSTSNAMVQVSDYVVSILRKYVMFLDRTQQEVESDINSFDEIQLNNFKLLNRILYKSSNYNPMFVDFTASIHLIKKYNLYMKKYGVV